eukprot:9516694-Prorocentrum_lima.AAC.1
MSASGKDNREAKLFPCVRCDSMLPFFNMMESPRPERQKPPGDLTFDEEERICGDRNERICPWCELDL